MRTLILCVDRDDDLGVKAGVTSPVVGRKDNLRAAISLGLKDPEDSDTNSIFSALKIFDQYYDNNQDVEIATLCGNKNVGTKSDTIIAFQLETVLQAVKPDHVIMVSDGAEDEFIIPIISSRVKIDSINRVIIRQQKNIEGTLYFITKAMQDEKISKNILIPLSLVLLIWGVFWIINLIGQAVGATLFALGLYILIKALHLEEPVLQLGKDFREALQTGKYVLVTMGLISAGVLSVGLYLGIIAIYPNKVFDFPYNILYFLEHSFIYFMVAIWVYLIGKTLDTYLREGIILRSSLSIGISVFAVWFIFLAVIHILQYRFQIVNTFNFPVVLINLIVGGLIGFISIEIYHYINLHFPDTHSLKEK
jgi:putative membrane protein